ncbi:hypothetical protein [Erythrobacter sp.]|uniref:hypothetical protein n=1 Tax=Erythrobacter sp. TaxID=1042 RepID=UPI001425D92B|nr:hypothetical protein [Erythrobacter sp.]QIQ87045.1 MAG: hypothetical protein G9473_10390 [Erythrobacter sp.]
MPLPSSTSDFAFDPKWLVIGFALGALAMVLAFDLKIGAAVASAFALIGLFYLWVRLRFAPPPGEPASERDAMIQRFDRLREQRRLAAERESDSAAQPGPRAGE